MRISLRAGALALLGLTLSYMPAVLGDESADCLQRLGEVVDPDGDCTFRLVGRCLTIGVPGTRHELDAAAGEANAPRLLRAVEGDFVATVAVGAETVPNGHEHVAGHAPCHGAGLLAWWGDGDYIHLDRNVEACHGKARSSASLTLVRDGEVMDESEVEVGNGRLFLRLERRGGRAVGSISQDGEHWQAVGDVPADFARDARIGVAATNAARTRYKAELSGLEITPTRDTVARGR